MKKTTHIFPRQQRPYADPMFPQEDTNREQDAPKGVERGWATFPCSSPASLQTFPAAGMDALHCKLLRGGTGDESLPAVPLPAVQLHLHLPPISPVKVSASLTQSSSFHKPSSALPTVYRSMEVFYLKKELWVMWPLILTVSSLNE